MMLAKLVGATDRDRLQHIVIPLMAEGPVADIIRESGVDVDPLGMKHWTGAPAATLKLAGRFRILRPDIVQTWLYHADLVGTAAAKLAGVRRLAWNVRNSDLDLSKYSRGITTVRRLLATLSPIPDLVITNSEQGRRAHELIGYRPRRWAMIGNGFDTERFRPDPERRKAVRRALGVSGTTPLIGLPARFDPAKDHQTFFDGAVILARRRSDVRFVLVGSGLSPDNPTVTRALADRGLTDRFHLLGDRRDMESVMAALDIVSLTSVSEGFPNVLGEGMASGALCLTTNVGNAAALVGEYGTVIPARDPVALADAWGKMLALDPTEKARLSAGARLRIVENYGLAAIARQYEDVYESLVAERGP